MLQDRGQRMGVSVNWVREEPSVKLLAPGSRPACVSTIQTGSPCFSAGVMHRQGDPGLIPRPLMVDRLYLDCTSMGHNGRYVTIKQRVMGACGINKPRSKPADLLQRSLIEPGPFKTYLPIVP